MRLHIAAGQGIGGKYDAVARIDRIQHTGIDADISLHAGKNQRVDAGSLQPFGKPFEPKIE